MRWITFIILLTAFGTLVYGQESQVDAIQALRQQREEALDKVANAYVTIMKLQRELDRLKAEKADSKVPDAAPK